MLRGILGLPRQQAAGATVICIYPSRPVPPACTAQFLVKHVLYPSRPSWRCGLPQGVRFHKSSNCTWIRASNSGRVLRLHSEPTGWVPAQPGLKQWLRMSAKLVNQCQIFELTRAPCLTDWGSELGRIQLS